MDENGKRAEEDRVLWRRLRAESQSTAPQEGRTTDEMALAAFLEGRLDATARAEVEARLASSPEELDLVLAAREALSEPDMAAPEAVVRRALALVPDPPGPGLAGRLGGLFAPLRQPLGWSGAVAGVLLACVVGFELGRSIHDSDMMLSQSEVAEAGFVFDPTDEEIL